MEQWERRFRASEVTFPTWARDAPDRMVFASNESGGFQVYAADLATGLRRRVTDIAVGVQRAAITPDGSRVLWFDDRTGDEVGRWIGVPLDGDAESAESAETAEAAESAEAMPLGADVPEGWSAGLALGDGVALVGVATAAGYTIHRVGPDGASRQIVESPASLQVTGVDRDGGLASVDHAERGDVMHPDVRVIDARTGDTVADLTDGDEVSLASAGWSPLPGDRRLALVSDRSGRGRPAVYDAATGDRVDFPLDELPGEVEVLGWYPDATALLVAHLADGRNEIYRLAIDGGALTPLDAPTGSVLGGRVRPDGTVWLRHTSGAHAPRVIALPDVTEVVAPEGPRGPDGYDYDAWEFSNPHGERVHGFVVTPQGRPGPHPTVLLIHGGPAWQWYDAWRPEVPAWVDHGFAVAMVNYRGSTGYGQRWRDAIIGVPGFTELEDEIAGLDDLVAKGVTDPARVVVSGGSWGGYLSLLALGRHPKRWLAGVAVVPVADYVAAFEDEAPDLQALDRVLFGGGVEEVRERYEERSPSTYVDDVLAPVLVITGANDTRCPIRQVRNYVARLEARGHDHAFDVFEAGHGSMLVDERVRQMRLQFDFLRERGLLP